MTATLLKTRRRCRELTSFNCVEWIIEEFRNCARNLYHIKGSRHSGGDGDGDCFGGGDGGRRRPTAPEKSSGTVRTVLFECCGECCIDVITGAVAVDGFDDEISADLVW